MGARTADEVCQVATNVEEIQAIGQELKAAVTSIPAPKGRSRLGISRIETERGSNLSGARFTAMTSN